MKNLFNIKLYSGSCPSCGSIDIWDDETMWGCNTCNWMGSN